MRKKKTASSKKGYENAARKGKRRGAVAPDGRKLHQRQTPTTKGKKAFLHQKEGKDLWLQGSFRRWYARAALREGNPRSPSSGVTLEGGRPIASTPKKKSVPPHEKKALRWAEE